MLAFSSALCLTKRDFWALDILFMGNNHSWYCGSEWHLSKAFPLNSSLTKEFDLLKQCYLEARIFSSCSWVILTYLTWLLWLDRKDHIEYWISCLYKADNLLHIYRIILNTCFSQLFLWKYARNCSKKLSTFIGWY